MNTIKNKELIGKIFFAFSIIFLAYLFITPLNSIICQIDEFFTMTVTTLPVSDIITVNTWDVHPPLYYFMGKIVAKLTEITSTNLLFNLNLLSILAYIGILIIAVTKIRKDYGWFACGLFAFSISIMSEFSRYYLIARMYSWAILFILLAFLFFKGIIENKSDKKSWIFLSLFSVLAAYTHYFAAISAACIYFILFIWLMKYRKEDIKIWLISVFACVLSYAPWVPSLINQLVQVHKGYWIEDLTLNKVIVFLGYYAHGFEGALALLSIFVLAVILIIYMKEFKGFEKCDNFIILSGFGVYFGTILLGVTISFLFRPIIDDRYLMPAAVLLWLAVSIILSKIQNRKRFIISMALISILLISGIANTISVYDDNYQSGTAQEKILDNIAQDNNSMLIVATKNDVMYYLHYSDRIDMYCVNTSEVFGVDTDHLHDLFDFKSINESQIDELIANNTDKNVYVIYWNEVSIKTPLDELYQHLLMHYCKVKK